MAIGFVCALQHWMVYPQKLVMKSQEVWDGRTSAAQSGAIVFILIKPPPPPPSNEKPTHNAGQWTEYRHERTMNKEITLA